MKYLLCYLYLLLGVDTSIKSGFMSTTKIAKEIDFVVEAPVSTQALSTQALSTKALSTKALSTNALSTNALKGQANTTNCHSVYSQTKTKF